MNRRAKIPPVFLYFKNLTNIFADINERENQ